MKGAAAAVICWLLVIVLLMGCVAAIITGDSELEPGSAAAQLRAKYRTQLLAKGGDWAQMLAQVAWDEYEELGDIENTGVKYCSHFDYPLVGWCCCFVYYCADICGFVEGTENTGDYPIFGSPTAWPPAGWIQLIEAGGTAFTAFDATMEPQPGDIYFLYNVPEGSGVGAATAVETYFLEQTHIGIVVENHGDYCISTIDGNCNSRVKGDPSTSVVTKYTWRDIRKELYPGTAIYGFIRPNYPEKWTELIGDLTQPYYFASSDPDVDYSGHTVEGLTDSQIANIKNTIYGEFGYDLGGAIAVAQSIRDNVDRAPSITYDNFVHSCQYFGGYPERSPTEYETEIVNTAFEYVFLNGGSAIQHPIFVFYAPVPADGLETDADFQAMFLAELEFVLEISPARFFSWHIDKPKVPLNIDPGSYSRTHTSGSGSMDYQMFVPKNPIEDMPLVIYLHDAGVTGVDQLQSNPLIAGAGAAYGSEFPFLAIAAYSPDGTWTSGTSPYILMELIDHVVDTYRIDKQNIIITGEGIGADGVWHLISTYGSYFSAAAPVGGRVPENISYRNCAEVRLWLSTKEGDDVEPMEELSGIIRRYRGTVRLTTYQNSAYGREVFDWMID